MRVTNKEVEQILTAAGVKYRHAAAVCGTTPAQLSRFLNTGMNLPIKQLERLKIGNPDIIFKDHEWCKCIDPTIFSSDYIETQHMLSEKILKIK